MLDPPRRCVRVFARLTCQHVVAGVAVKPEAAVAVSCCLVCVSSRKAFNLLFGHQKPTIPHTLVLVEGFVVPVLADGLGYKAIFLGGVLGLRVARPHKP